MRASPIGGASFYQRFQTLIVRLKLTLRVGEFAHGAAQVGQEARPFQTVLDAEFEDVVVPGFSMYL